MASPKIIEDFTGTERFEIRRRLGAGGMGVVYEAIDRERETIIALKTILRLDATTLYRFKHEFRGLADVVHPNFVRLHELFSEGDVWFFTMELIEGVDFLRYVCPEISPLDDKFADSDWKSALEQADWIQKTRTRELYVTTSLETAEEASGSGLAGESSSGAVPVTEETAETHRSSSSSRSDSGGHDRAPVMKPPPAYPPRLRATLRHLAEALNDLHGMGKLHRDIKPSNVLVTNRGRVVVLDFGLTTELDQRRDAKTTEGLIVGTVGYMSPEQASGKPLSPASDWYSLGVMLFRALTGRMPFEGTKMEVLLAKQAQDAPRPSELGTNIPEDLEELCTSLLRRNPESRPTGPEIIERLGGAAADGALSHAGRNAGSTVFVGRGRELAALEEALGATRRGETGVVFLSGSSGSGKSALVHKFLETVESSGGPVILAGRCYQQESVAYKALDSLIDVLSRYLRRLDRVDAEGLVPRDAAALGRIFPVLRRVDAIAEAPRRGAEVPDPQEVRRRGFAALRELLARLGDRRPLLLWIDDLQWGDLDSAALILDLLQPPDAPVLLLVASFRREDATTSSCLKALLAEKTGLAKRRDLVVEPLSRNEARELSRILLDRDDPGADALGEMVARESGGSPYFVHELMQYLTAGGEVGDSLALTGGAVHLDEVLWRRILRLPADARRLIELLAVAGRPLRQTDACRAAGLGAEGYSAIAVLRTNRLVRGLGQGTLDEIETYHDRIRESIIDHLDQDTRREYHRALAIELSAGGKADAETLAVHFDAAGEPMEAGRHFAAAAHSAATALAFGRAAKLYRRAIELLPAAVASHERRALEMKLGEALANAGLGGESARVYQAAAEGADPETALELQRRAGHEYLVSGHIDEGLAAFRNVLDRVGILRPKSPRHALRMLLVERVRLFLRGLRFRERSIDRISSEVQARIDTARSVAVGTSVVDVIQGSYFQTRSLLLSLEAGDPFRISLALAWEAVHSSCQGVPARRRTAKLIAAATELANRLVDPRALGMAALSTGAALYLEGRMRESLGHLDSAAEILRDQCTGMVWELDTARIFSLWARFYMGEFAELGERYRGFFKESRERGDRYMESTLGVYPGVLYLLNEDQPEEADELGDRSIALWTKSGFHVQHLTHYYGKVYIELYEGKAEAAWRRVTATSPVIRESLLPRIQHVNTDLHQIAGRAAVAAAAVNPSPVERSRLLARGLDSARRIEAMRVPWGVGAAGLIRSAAAFIAGDRDRSHELLRSSIRRLEEESAGMFLAAAKFRLSAMVGGAEGERLSSEAEAFMTSQKVRDPRRMTNCFAPGFDRA